MDQSYFNSVLHLNNQRVLQVDRIDAQVDRIDAALPQIESVQFAAVAVCIEGADQFHDRGVFMPIDELAELCWVEQSEDTEQSEDIELPGDI